MWPEEIFLKLLQLIVKPILQSSRIIPNIYFDDLELRLGIKTWKLVSVHVI